MFGLGMWEIVLVIALAVMLFPPKELPKLARSIAKIYGQIRKTAEDFRSSVLEDEELREPIDEIKGAYNDARWEVRDAERKARQQLAKAQMEMRMATARRLQAEREAKQAELGSAGSAGAVRVAAANDEGDGDDDEDEGQPAGGPVAGADPRTFSAGGMNAVGGTIAAGGERAYTSDSGDSDSGETGRRDEPREGVA